MTFSDPHDLDAIDSAPVYFLILADRVLNVICSELQAETIGKRQLIIVRGAALSGKPAMRSFTGAGSFQIGQSVPETSDDILAQVGVAGFLHLRRFHEAIWR